MLQKWNLQCTSREITKKKNILPNFSGKNWLVHLSIGHQLGTIDFTEGTPVRLHIFSCLMIFVDDGYCELGILTGALQCVTCTFARMAYDHYMTVLGIRDSSSSSTRENMNSEKRNHLKHDIIISTDIQRRNNEMNQTETIDLSTDNTFICECINIFHMQTNVQQRILITCLFSRRDDAWWDWWK